jgi:peptidoglycan/LPS O-acetylase OafA/YrhL
MTGALAATKEKVHFPGLNGIRAIAAFVVILFHFNLHIDLFGMQPIRYLVNREEMSRIAVTLFLVLSGFLITYLLLTEKKTNAAVNIRKFYARRILRIWPLYYLVILIILVMVAGGYRERDLQYSLTAIGIYSVFLSNFAIIYGLKLLTIAPLWSVGVEEQFYAVWPVFINRTTNIWRSLWFFLIGYVSLKFIFSYIIYNTLVAYGLELFAFDAFAVGGIAAYLYFTKSRLLKRLYSPALQAACWVFFLVSLVRGKIHVIHFIDKNIYEFAFAIIILNVSTNPRPLISLENRLFNFLGRISFGIYMYHMILYYFLSVLLGPYIAGLNNIPLQFVVVYAITVTATVAVASLSYRYFESPFLRMKTRLAIVPNKD